MTTQYYVVRVHNYGHNRWLAIDEHGPRWTSIEAMAHRFTSANAAEYQGKRYDTREGSAQYVEIANS